MRRSNNNQSVEWTSNKDEDKDVMRRTSDDVLRRVSEITSNIDEFDLRKNYQTVVACLVRCESTIKTLQ